MDAKRVVSGTWGSAWLNSEQLPEAYGVQAKVSKNKTTVPMAGRMMVGHKTLSTEGTGSLRVYHVDSASLKRAAALIRGILTDDNTIISKVADPQAFGAERIALYGVDFDDAILADWEVGVLSKRECPFTFDNWEPLDMIEEVSK